MPPETTAAARPSAAITILIDAVLVVVFCLIGRLSHSEGVFGDVVGLFGTIWPFLAALIAVHAVALAVGVPAQRIVPGVLVWLVTVAGGIGLRALAGQGTATAFVVVAALTLALFLLGWRVINLLVQRRRAV
ncbi:DUF3054 domain-containing protein [Microbacterium tumbae]